MKNILLINAKENFNCDLVQSTDSNISSLILRINCDSLLHPYIEINGKVDVEITSETMEVDLSGLVAANIIFTIHDDLKVSETFTIIGAGSIDKNYILQKIDNYNYKLDCHITEQEKLLNMFYPIGSTYENALNNANPSTFMGGTWEPFAEGRVTVGVGVCTDVNGEKITFTENMTGGEFKHALSTGELASHTHSQNSHNHSQNAHLHHPANSTGKFLYHVGGNLSNETVGGISGSGQKMAQINDTSSDYWSSHNNTANATATNNATTATNNNTGNNTPHNNMQPYQAVYKWIRVA